MQAGPGFFICSDAEIGYEPSKEWEDMTSTEQMHTLRDAYAEEKFRSCTNHSWELIVDYGDVSLWCPKCQADYEFVTPDYRDYLCTSATVDRVSWVTDEARCDYGSDVDQYLDVILD